MIDVRSAAKLSAIKQETEERKIRIQRLENYLMDIEGQDDGGPATEEIEMNIHDILNGI